MQVLLVKVASHGHVAAAASRELCLFERSEELSLEHQDALRQLLQKQHSSAWRHCRHTYPDRQFLKEATECPPSPLSQLEMGHLGLEEREPFLSGSALGAATFYSILHPRTFLGHSVSEIREPASMMQIHKISCVYLQEIARGDFRGDLCDLRFFTLRGDPPKAQATTDSTLLERNPANFKSALARRAQRAKASSLPRFLGGHAPLRSSGRCVLHHSYRKTQ